MEIEVFYSLSGYENLEDQKRSNITMKQYIQFLEKRIGPTKKGPSQELEFVEKYFRALELVALSKLN